MSQYAQIMISPHESFVEPVLSFIMAYVKGLGVEKERCEELSLAARAAVTVVLKSYSGGNTEQPIEICLRETNGKLMVDVVNLGVPIIPGSTSSWGINPLGEKRASRLFEKISIENRGRQGQIVSFQVKLGNIHGRIVSSTSNDQVEVRDEDIIYRTLQPGEEGALSQLFFHVYEYNYINEIVYYPEKIARMLREQTLISVVASLPDGRLLGHLGLMKWKEDPPVYEPCFGLVDPIATGKGVFRRILRHIMEISDSLPLHYCFFDFVTNHDYSQKLVAEYNPCELSIHVGCQGEVTQAKLEKLRIGEDPKASNRFTILYSIIPKVKNPFGSEVLLPNNLGEMVGFLLKPLNVTWSPAPRFDMLEPEGEYRMHCEPSQGSVIFDCGEPGVTAVENILQDWRQFIREGYRYAAVEVPLDRPGISKLYDMLAAQGFFIAGFITWRRSSRLGFRFQTIAPAKLDFSEIRLYSENAKRLLEIIREDYERNVNVH